VLGIKKMFVSDTKFKLTKRNLIIVTSNNQVISSINTQDLLIRQNIAQP